MEDAKSNSDSYFRSLSIPFLFSDMSDLWPLENRTYRPDVLNGISISKDDGILYVTGKLWDRMFRLKLLGFS